MKNVFDNKYELVEEKMDDGVELTPEEIAAYEEASEQYQKDMEEAIRNNDQSRIAQLYEDNA